MSLPAGFGGGGDFGAPARGRGDKGLSLPLAETFRLAWADPDLKARILFVLAMFAVFTLGTHIPVPIRGYSSEDIYRKLEALPFFQYLDAFGGGALRRVSILALGLQPYITASIIIQVLTTAFPQWKKELQEGGEYARKTQNKRTRVLALALCFAQGWATLAQMQTAIPSLGAFDKALVILFWTAGAMFMLWLGEQISEKGIGNGTSLMIFAGIVLSLPNQFATLWHNTQTGVVNPLSLVAIAVIFIVATWFIVYFTTAQRRIPIQHMRRQVGTKVMGGATSYLPLSVNMAGVMPIIFASTFLYLPGQFASFFGNERTPLGRGLLEIGSFLQPTNTDRFLHWLPLSKGVFGSLAYLVLIFLFTYFWTAIQYNVEDISQNLKRGGSFIPGVRPGKQTKDFLDGVISRITLVGAAFVACVALLQYVAPVLAFLPKNTYISALGGTSLLIMVSVALETMRQIEANLLMKQYGQ
ncbi:preprotein translocase subunit SecY [bacterium]|nr:MAG: preprotein translocase subunit SecY [bacterium]